MIVLCIFQEGGDLSSSVLDVIPAYRDTTFFLKINTQYVICGMSIWTGILHYLVVDVWGRPSWFPAELFAVIDDKMPELFHFKFYRKYSISAVWGYKELLNDVHYDRLIERQDDDLEIFFKNKESLDTQNNKNEKAAEGRDNETICALLQAYYEKKIATQQFIETFNHLYCTFFNRDLSKKYQAMFDTLYAITKTYTFTDSQDEQLKKSMQKLYFSINFPEIQFKHQ